VAVLDVPAQDDLRVGSLLGRSDPTDHRLIEEPPVPEGTVRLHRNAMTGRSRTSAAVGEVRMHLDLIDTLVSAMMRASSTSIHK
jgi:hypothetical protein